ncbi:MAG: hypothetical protein AAF790_07490, partial [Planctomycetota bacterium]
SAEASSQAIDATGGRSMRARRVHQAWLPHACWLSLLLAGCGGPEESLREVALRCAALPGAKASANEALRAEVLQLQEARQTPGLLRPPTAIGEDAARLLADALSDATRYKLFPELERLMPSGRFLFDTPALDAIGRLLRSHAQLRLAIQRAEQAPACVFRPQNALGNMAPMRYLDDAAIAARLRLNAAAPDRAGVAGGGPDVAAAIEEVRGAMYWIGHLARVGRIEARVLAARLRGEALTVIEAIADNAATQRPDLERLYTLLRQTLEAWPGDAAALIGDRSVSLHTYELIREGYLEQVLTDEDRALLERRRLLASVQSMGATQIDEDQLAYLGAVRALIAAAQQPHHQRVERVQAVMKPFNPEEAASVEAPLASNLLLPSVPAALHAMALDRAACEVWAIALAAAADLDPPPLRVNPVTGVAYEVNRLAGSLIVRSGDPELRDAYARVAP